MRLVISFYLILNFRFFHCFRKTGNSRPTIGPNRGRADRHYNLPRNKRTPPRGMYINHDDLTAIASGTAAQTDNLLKSLDRELLTLKRIVRPAALMRCDQFLRKEAAQRFSCYRCKIISKVSVRLKRKLLKVWLTIKLR